MITVTNPDPLLIVEDVHAAYVKKEILHGVSLTINRGEIVALLGGNGSGKSTMLKTIGGLLRPTRGRVLLDGADIRGDGVQARQAMGIGYLMQGGRVFPNLTVSENFSIANRYRKRTDDWARSTLGDFFPALAQRGGTRAGLLSGGQRQMLAIEMVLSQRPRLLLLDEPTAALSTDVAHSILGILLEYTRQSSCSILLVEQNVAEAKTISTRCLRLALGRVHADADQEKTNTI
jgi:ABC-type branched-subunit amino acid transport system ATPase component